MSGSVTPHCPHPVAADTLTLGVAVAAEAAILAPQELRANRHSPCLIWGTVVAQRRNHYRSTRNRHRKQSGSYGGVVDAQLLARSCDRARHRSPGLDCRQPHSIRVTMSKADGKTKWNIKTGVRVWADDGANGSGEQSLGSTFIGRNHPAYRRHQPPSALGTLPLTCGAYATAMAAAASNA